MGGGQRAAWNVQNFRADMMERLSHIHTWKHIDHTTYAPICWAHETVPKRKYPDREEAEEDKEKEEEEEEERHHQSIIIFPLVKEKKNPILKNKKENTTLTTIHLSSRR